MEGDEALVKYLITMKANAYVTDKVGLLCKFEDQVSRNMTKGFANVARRVLSLVKGSAPSTLKSWLNVIIRWKIVIKGDFIGVNLV